MSYTDPLPEEERTYRCFKCLDGSPWITQVYPPTHKWAGMTYAVPCECDAGKAVESGAWFRRIFVMQTTGNRVRDEYAERQLGMLLEQYPLKRRWLPEAIEACRQRYESEKKRKTEALHE